MIIYWLCVLILLFVTHNWDTRNQFILDPTEPIATKKFLTMCLILGDLCIAGIRLYNLYVVVIQIVKQLLYNLHKLLNNQCVRSACVYSRIHYCVDLSYVNSLGRPARLSIGLWRPSRHKACRTSNSKSEGKNYFKHLLTNLQEQFSPWTWHWIINCDNKTWNVKCEISKCKGETKLVYYDL